MSRVTIYQHSPKRALASKGSARSIAVQISHTLEQNPNDPEISFENLVSVAPSFFDELPSIIDESSRSTGNKVTSLVISEPPGELAPKHHTICRVHGLKIAEDESGNWVIARN